MTLLNIYRGYEAFFRDDIEDNHHGSSSSSSSSSSAAMSGSGMGSRGGGGGGSGGTKTISSQQSDTLRSWCDAHCLQPRLMARAREIRNNLEKMLQRFAPIDTPLSSCGDDTVAVRKCLVAGYFAHAAQLGSDGRYLTVRGRHPVAVHSLSVLARFGAPPEWVIFNDVVHTKQAMIREVTRIDPHWLVDMASHFYQLK